MPTANASPHLQPGNNTIKISKQDHFSFWQDSIIILRSIPAFLWYSDKMVSQSQRHPIIQNFPGMSAGWMIDQEPFLEIHFYPSISMFKPRISYGLNGNVSGIGNYEVQGSTDPEIIMVWWILKHRCGQ